MTTATAFTIPDSAFERIRDVGFMAWAVYSAVAYLIHRDGACEVPTRKLADALGLTERAVRKGVCTLVSTGLLTVERRSSDRGTSLASAYHLAELPPSVPGGTAIPPTLNHGSPYPEPRFPLPGTAVHPTLNHGSPTRVNGGSPSHRDDLLSSSCTTYKKMPNGASYPSAFLRFWDAYPRRVGKKAALKAWRTALRDVLLERRCDEPTAEQVLAIAARTFAESDKGRGEAKYIPYPQTWLAQGRWADDPAEWSDTKRLNGKKLQLKYT